MFADTHYLREIKPADLDKYLADGWFRMHQTMFTTEYLLKEDKIFRVFWLRYRLDKYKSSDTSRKLEKLNRHFRIEIGEVMQTCEEELLFQKYLLSKPWGWPDSLEQLLFDDSSENIFNTVSINMYDQEQLIASGLFDLGEKSAAGITAFYNPDYKKYSLGKYLIFKKIEYCRSKGLEYFYPGYFVPGVNAFDYKLSIGNGALEYFQSGTRMWLPIAEFKNQEGI
jgi:arginine-tRNA-protein transferase